MTGDGITVTYLVQLYPHFGLLSGVWHPFLFPLQMGQAIP